MPRKPHEFNFIYKTTCLITGRYYIGMHSTSNLNDGYLGSGTRLWKSINKHGKENHSIEILEFLPDRKALAARERELVNEDLLKDPLSMNIMLGGEAGGFINKDHQLKCSSAGGKTTNPEKSRKASETLTQTHKRRIEDGTHRNWKHNYDWTGKSHNEQTKLKIGLANSTKQLGENNSQFGTKWMCHPVNGPIKVKSTEIDSYLKLGYSIGRKIPNK